MSSLKTSGCEKEAENAEMKRHPPASHIYAPSFFESEKKTAEVGRIGSGSGDLLNASHSAETENKVSDGDDSDDDDYPKNLSLFLIVLAIGMSVFLVALDMTIVATAIPKMTDRFHSLNDVSWYGSAFLLPSAAFQSTWGKVYKYYPLKMSFLVGIFIFELGSLICAVAPTSKAFIVGRAIAGAGSAGIGSGAFTIIAFIASPKKRPVFTGIVGLSYGVASVIGPLLGGVFTDKLSWRWCFYINLPIGGLSAAGIIIFFHTPKKATPVKASTSEKLLQMDLIGTGLLLSAIVTYILFLQYGGKTKPWNSATVIVLIVLFVIILIAFILWERFQDERAIIPPRLIRNRLIAVNSLYAFLFVGSYFLVVYYLPIYFQSIQNVGPTLSGVRNVPLIVSVSIALIVSGGSITQNGHTAPLMVIGSVLATIAAGSLYSLDIGTSTGKWIGYQILGGAGWGIAYQVPINAAQGAVVPNDIASVTAIIVFSQVVGGAVFVSAAQSAFVNQLLIKLAKTAPNVDSSLVLATGASELHQVFTPNELPGVLVAYMHGLKAAFAIALAAVGVSLLLTPLNSWKKINAHADPTSDTSSTSAVA